jgi:F-type H+-transporting ATPase subunit b
VIKINITALFQLLSFLFLLFVLKRLLFKPILEILDERKRTLERQARAAREYRAEARERRDEYQREIAAARRQALHIQEEAEEEALALRAKTLSDKRAQAAAELARAKEQLEHEIEAQAAGVRGQVEPLGELVVEKVLGR